MKRISFLVACMLALSAHAMTSSSIPTKFPLAWGANAGAGYIRSIPTASQILITPGAASLTDGFPPLTFQDEATGGVPLAGQDVNGILNQISAWSQWQNAAGAVTYDSAFSTAIGGYPKGALLYATAGGAWWLSTAENNTSNPDAGGANWQAIAYGSVYAGNPNGNVAGVAPSSISLTNSLLWDTSNHKLWLCTTTGNAAGAVWTWVGGSLGTAASANASSATGSLAAVSGSTIAGHVPKFTDTAGTIAEGPIPTSTASMLVATDGPFVVGHVLAAADTNGTATDGGAVLTVSGTTTTGHLAKFLNTSGTIQDGPAMSSNTGTMAAASGSFTSGHLVTSSDTTGTISGGPAISSNTGTMAAASGSFTAGHLIYAADTAGTIQDGGAPPVIPVIPTGVTNLLNTLTASNSAFLEDTTSLTSTYSHYEIVFENIVLASNTVQVLMQVYDGGLKSANTYVTTQMLVQSGGVTSAQVVFTSGEVTPAILNNGSIGLSGVITVQVPSNTSVYKIFSGLLNFESTSGLAMENVQMMWEGDTGAVTGFRISASTGNITSGKIKIYGRN